MKQEHWLWVHMLAVYLRWDCSTELPYSSRVRFYQAGASEAGRADTINGDALDAEVCLQMVISFQWHRHTDCYGNETYQYSTHNGILVNRKPVLINLQLSVETNADEC